ncbi:radical SAM family heme chaperone HemW [Lutibaculum baratangense]|uniref:Heme chaperone HemW n=1 Tax=Lutibaculum baratangense AMV1 TaxID=631454 RepID=V4RIN3_9HYPH|nr:radical SAM family heme chaperone HemW [Lutibaculum baratangense]ESR25946.1 Radical SAM family enzyme, similar to coproporphyrinogen III oxidase, oxygen-independent, clustered with nucleoside-triphosphatase RdgB [Lutibaculum baratangense AMV1]
MSDETGAGFGVYVHWPFCAAKCPYCDFNSHVRREIDEQAYADALARELAHMAELAPGRTVGSVFFGGGTPSLMKPSTVAHVLDAIARNWNVAPDVEVSLEANPSSVEAERFAGYRAAGVNRVSLGVQSLDDRQLQFLGRLHNAEEARRAIEVARSNFDRMSFDMIYARPGQTVEDWSRELQAAIDLAVDHLSLYQLTIEPETAFAALHARGRIRLPDEELGRALYDATLEVTERRGLPAYEISNHARPGSECRHNLIYWRCGEYAAAGPGAHGRLDIDGRRTALATEKRPEEWLASVTAHGHGLVERETLYPQEVADELLVMGLRLREGFDLARYMKLMGKPLAEGRVNDLVGYGLIERLSPERLRATPAGFAVLNAVVADLAA